MNRKWLIYCLIHNWEYQNQNTLPYNELCDKSIHPAHTSHHRVFTLRILSSQQTKAFLTLEKTKQKNNIVYFKKLLVNCRSMILTKILLARYIIDDRQLWQVEKRVEALMRTCPNWLNWICTLCSSQCFCVLFCFVLVAVNWALNSDSHTASIFESDSTQVGM
jgi:hypothetical protein